MAREENVQEETYKIVKELKEDNKNGCTNEKSISQEDRKLVSEFIESIYTLEKLFEENFKIDF